MPRRTLRVLSLVSVFLALAYAVHVRCARALELTRPSRGAPVTVMSAVTATTTSAVYDWSAFTGVTLSMSSTGSCQGTITGQVSATVDGTFVAVSSGLGSRNFQLPDPSGNTRVDGYADVTLSFVRFVFTPTNCPDGVTVVAVPEPYTLRATVEGPLANNIVAARVGNIFPVLVGGLRPGAPADTTQIVYVNPGGQVLVDTGNYSVAATTDTVVAVTNAAGGTQVVAAAGATTAVRHTLVQNLSLTAIACSLGGVPVIGTTGFLLAPEPVAINTGDGGHHTWEGYTGAITCIAAGAGGSVAVQRW